MKKSALDGQLAAKDDFSGYDATEKTALNEATLESLQAMAQDLLNRERAVIEAENEVLKAKKDLAEIKENELPTILEKYGLDNFSFKDKITGLWRKIEIKNGYRVSLPPKTGQNADPDWKKKHEMVMAWLTEIGKGGNIKKNFEIAAGLMSDEEITEVGNAIKAHFPDLDLAVLKFIEPMTLKKIVSTMMDAGEKVHEFINVKAFHEAKIKGSL